MWFWWFASLIQHNVFKIYLCCSIHSYFIPCYGQRTFPFFGLPMYQMVETWVVSTFWLSWIMLVQILVHMFLCGPWFWFPVGTHLGVDLLSRIVNLCVTRCRASRKGLHRLTSDQPGAASPTVHQPLLCCVLNCCHPSVDERGHLVVLVPIFLMTEIVTHLFMCLWHVFSGEMSIHMICPF